MKSVASVTAVLMVLFAMATSVLIVGFLALSPLIAVLVLGLAWWSAGIANTPAHAFLAARLATWFCMIVAPLLIYGALIPPAQDYTSAFFWMAFLVLAVIVSRGVTTVQPWLRWCVALLSASGAFIVVRAIGAHLAGGPSTSIAFVITMSVATAALSVAWHARSVFLPALPRETSTPAQQ